MRFTAVVLHGFLDLFFSAFRVFGGPPHDSSTHYADGLWIAFTKEEEDTELSLSWILAF
jgi:hypothetical protein